MPATPGRAWTAADLPALATVRKALEESLGLKFEGREGRTLLPLHAGANALLRRLLRLGALAPDARQAGQGRFDWDKAANFLHVPILRKLFRELADRTQLDESET